MYGLRHLSDPQPFLKKPWRIQSNCPEPKKLSLTCDGSHFHKPTAGACAVASGMFTVKLVNTLSKLLSVPLAKIIRTLREREAHPILRGRRPVRPAAFPAPAPAAPDPALGIPVPAPAEAAPVPLTPERFRNERALLSGLIQMQHQSRPPSQLSSGTSHSCYVRAGQLRL